MSYPTVDFQPVSTTLGVQPVGQSSATKQHELGTVIVAKDLTYGVGEFIYLAGVASTSAGDLVCYNSSTGATVRAVHGGSTSTGPVAVAMSDNGADSYGWYQIAGAGPVKAATVAANAQLFLTSTAGQVDDVAVGGDQIDGLTAKAATSGGFATCQLSRPSVTSQGGGTGTATADTVASTSGTALTLKATNTADTGPGVIIDTAVAMTSQYPLIVKSGGVAQLNVSSVGVVTGGGFQTNSSTLLSGNTLTPGSGTLTLNGAVSVSGNLSTTAKFTQGGSFSTPANAGTVTHNCNAGNYNLVTCDASVSAITIGAPSNASVGQILTFVILNSSGGAITTTWDAVFHMATWTEPANGKMQAISFIWNGGAWYELCRTTGTIAV